jgi:phosphomannomutase
VATKPGNSGIDQKHFRDQRDNRGKPGDNLTPLDVVRFAAAFGSWLLEKSNNRKIV